MFFRKFVQKFLSYRKERQVDTTKVFVVTKETLHPQHQGVVQRGRGRLESVGQCRSLRLSTRDERAWVFTIPDTTYEDEAVLAQNTRGQAEARR